MKIKKHSKTVICGDGLRRTLNPPTNPKEAIHILKVRSRDEDAGYKTPCRIWVGAKSNGYGELHYNGEKISPHRLVWIINNGNIPDGIEVCHHCNNPACCRVDHLWLGTHIENMRHAGISGVMGKAKGESHGSRKLLSHDVIFIRINKDLSNASLARWFNVSNWLISKIKSGMIWKTIAQ